MKAYITLSLFVAIASGVFAACTGGNASCPSGHTLTYLYTDFWSCCDLTKPCQTKPGSSFARNQKKYSYTVSTPTGTATYECVSGPTDDQYPSPCLCCGGGGGNELERGGECEATDDPS